MARGAERVTAAIVFAALVLAAASTGALFKPGAWYEELRKPDWTPPNWAFPVVWTALYAMIGYAGWLVWRTPDPALPLAFWGAQLVLNAAWSWLFFGLRRMESALLDVALLLLCVLGFIVSAHEQAPTASLLFLPYLVWVAVAAALNLRVLQLNPLATRDAARIARFP